MPRANNHRRRKKGDSFGFFWIFCLSAIILLCLFSFLLDYIDEVISILREDVELSEFSDSSYFEILFLALSYQFAFKMNSALPLLILIVLIVITSLITFYSLYRLLFS